MEDVDVYIKEQWKRQTFSKERPAKEREREAL